MTTNDIWTTLSRQGWTKMDNEDYWTKESYSTYIRAAQVKKLLAIDPEYIPIYMASHKMSCDYLEVTGAITIMGDLLHQECIVPILQIILEAHHETE
jgi:hypothetical protein